MAAAKKTTKKSTKKKSTTKKAPAKKTAKASAKKAAVTKKVVQETKTVSAVSDNTPAIKAGTLIFAALILAIGLVGWYILTESDKLNDEYDKANEANNTILKKIDTPANQGAEAPDTNTAE